MKCPNHEDLQADVKEIKRDVKSLLAFMNQQIGQEKNAGKIAAIVSFLVSTAIALIAIIPKWKY
jgi:hypothetical protein